MIDPERQPHRHKIIKLWCGILRSSNFFCFLQKSFKKVVFPYFFPRMGTLTLTPGMGVGGWVVLVVVVVGRPFRIPKNPQISKKNSSYENCSHSWDSFQTKCRNMLKHIFKICSYIQKNKQNPIKTLRNTNHSTKHTQNIKIYFK